MPSPLNQLKALFIKALELNSDGERRVFLDRECGDDSRLWAEVHSLLAAHADANGFLEQLVPDGDTLTVTAPAVELVGTQVGPYTICERIGQGGMGIVYVATQTEPVRRKVALKIIKPGMDSREVLGRFASERQALAMMTHPHIAKIFDGGTTPTGRPYFVMEYISGRPITEFCDQQNLDLPQRLRLFQTVCQAVQHAHQRGVIHRDLKPTNILVERYEGVAVPKIIDFGIAKAIDPRTLEHSVYTQFAHVVGTPLYMSPEQADLGQRDIDTRSDIYSLGVILYELLTGQTPIDRSLVKKLGFEEMRRMILNEDPVRPSSRVSTLDPGMISTLSERRSIEPHLLSPSLRKDLDWIVMKALEKDRNRRYESASAFAQDIERYLNDEPVQACPPSVGYRLQKYVKRHAVLLATSTLVLLSALVGTFVSLSYAQKAEDAADAAKSAQWEAEQQAHKAKQAEEWSRTLLYASDMKLVSDALEIGDSLRAAELLRRHIPNAGETDLRGFEWYYFHKRVSNPQIAAFSQGAWVDDVEVSPDGQWLATTAARGMVRLYDTASWMLKASFDTKSDSVHGIAWSPDCQLLGAACGGGSIQIWEVASQSPRYSIDGHADSANDAVFSTDGKSLYSAGEDGLVKKWNAETGQVELVFTGHTRAVNAIALSPDGKTLVSVGSDENLGLWNSDTAEQLHLVNLPHQGRLVCAAFSPDGHSVAFGSIAGHLNRADVATGNPELLTKELDGVEELVFLADGRYLATANRGGSVQIYSTEDASSGSWFPALQWIAHEGRALALTALRNGEMLITGGRDEMVKVWSPDMESTHWHLSIDSNTVDLAAGSGDRIYRAGLDIETWEGRERRQLDAFAEGKSPSRKIACSTNGRYLADILLGHLTLYDMTTGKVVKEWSIDQRNSTSPLAVSADGRFIALDESYDHEILLLFDRDSSDPPRRIPSKQCHCVAFSSDSRWLAMGRGNDCLLFPMPSDGLPRVLSGHSSSVSDAAFSPDGQWLATVGNDRLLIIWEMASGVERYSIVAHSDYAKGVIFSPDGRTIATCADREEVKFWHTATGQPVGRLTLPGTVFKNLKFTGDGHSLLGHIDTIPLGGHIVVFDAGPPGSKVHANPALFSPPPHRSH